VIERVAFVFFLFCFSTVHGQSLSHQYELPRAAATSDISCIHKDSSGALYLGTNRGLFSFDGKEWQQFLLPDSLLNQSITAITSHSHFQVLGLENGKILLFDGFSFRSAFPDIINISNRIDKIVVSKEEFIIATYGEGLFIVHADSSYSHYTLEDGVPSADIYDIAVSADRSIYLGTDRGLAVIPPSGSPSTLLSDHIILHLCKNRKSGSIYAIDYDGHVFSVHSKYVDSVFTTSISPKAFLANTSGDLFILGSDTLWKFEQMDIPAPSPILLKSRAFWKTACIDEQNQIWLVNGNGQLIVTPTHLHQFTPNIPAIQCISAVDSLLYLGTEQGLFLYNPNRDKIVNHLLKNCNILDLEYVPNERELWCASFGKGIYILSPDDMMVEKLSEKEGLINDNLLNIRVQDSLVLAATLGGLSILDVKTHKSITNLYDSIPQAQYIYDALIDEENILWLGKDQRGLLRINSKGQIASFFKESTVYQNHPGKQGIFSATAQAGVKYLDRQSFHKSTIIEKQSCLAITEDKNGILYFLMEDGVHVCEPEKKIVAPLYPQYTQNQSYQYNHAFNWDAQGHLWWAQENALYKYTPESDFPLEVSLDILRFSLGDRKFSKEKNKIVVSHTDHLFQVEYRGYWLNEPSAITYRYKIAGYDSDWQYSRDQNAIYPKLPPGEYRFIVESDIRANFQNPARKEIHFTILPAIWQRLWFQLALLGSFFFIVFIIARYFINRNKKIEALKAAQIRAELETIKSQINPHFMFNNFNMLLNIVEENPNEAVVYIEQLSDFYRDMLQFRKETVISIYEELDIVKRYFYLLQHRFGEGLKYRILGDIPDNTYIIPFSIQLLVENAVKHNRISKSKPLKIDIWIKEDFLIVRNNWQRKKNTAASTGFGLESLQTQYETLANKSIEVEQNEQEYIVTIPILKEKIL